MGNDRSLATTPITLKAQLSQQLEVCERCGSVDLPCLCVSSFIIYQFRRVYIMPIAEAIIERKLTGMKLLVMCEHLWQIAEPTVPTVVLNFSCL